MGITFRSSEYIRHVMCRGRTIKDGEAAAIWNSKGVHTQIIGPRRVWLINSTIRFLKRYKAESHQYIKVSHRDGRVEHVRGPVTLYLNPAYHDQVVVHNGFRLCSASESLIVFTNHEAAPSPNSLGVATKSADGDFDLKIPAKVEKAVLLPTTLSDSNSQRIIRGPTLFFTNPNQFVHTFSWSDLTTPPTSGEVPKKLFQILHTSTTLALDRLNIPTMDGYSFDAMLLLDIKCAADDDRLFENRDPMEGVRHGLLADAQQLGATIRADVDDGNDEIMTKLSSLDSYPRLVTAASRCGLVVEAVRVTSVVPCQNLRDRTDGERRLAAENRAQTTRQEQRTRMKVLEREEKRREEEEEVEARKKRMLAEDDLDRESHELRRAALERKLALERREAEGENEIQFTKEERVLEFLTRMKNDMDVDMTKLMTSVGGVATVKETLVKSDVLKLLLDTATTKSPSK